MAAHQIIKAARVPVIKLVETNSEPDLALGSSAKWHLCTPRCGSLELSTGS